MDLYEGYKLLIENPRNVLVQTKEGNIVLVQEEIEWFRETVHVYPGSFNPLHDGHRSIFDGIVPHVSEKYFETSITRWQKPPVSLIELETRLKQFVGYAPIIVTNCARFVEKIGALNDISDIRFHVGIDTLIRMRDDYGEIGIDGLRARFVVYDRIVNGELKTLKSEFKIIPHNCKAGFDRPKEVLLISSTEIRNKLAKSS